jgi:hypothetical protein
MRWSVGSVGGEGGPVLPSSFSDSTCTDSGAWSTPESTGWAFPVLLAAEICGPLTLVGSGGDDGGPRPSGFTSASADLKVGDGVELAVGGQGGVDSVG